MPEVQHLNHPLRPRLQPLFRLPHLFQPVVTGPERLLYGVHGGYNQDFGRFVLGGELDYDFSDISLSGGAGDIDNISRAKVKAGYDLGSTLLYATAGIARADTDLGTDNGEFYGVGVNYQFSPAWTLGGEILAHQFEDFNATGTDIDVDTISLRASYNF